MSTVVTVVLLVLGIRVVLMIVVGVWSRRGEAKGDPPGVRTVCSFAGGEGYATEDEKDSEANEGPGALGEGLLRAMLPELERRGAKVEQPDRDDYGWGVTVEVSGKAGYVLLGYVGDPDADWLIQVLDPSSGGPADPAVLPLVNEALRSLGGVTHIAWHSRELHARGDTSSARPSPLD